MSSIYFFVNQENASYDPWSFQKATQRKSFTICVLLSVSLAAIAAVATYFSLVHGLMLYDFATTSLLQFGAGFMIYCGVVFSVVAVGNLVYLAGKLLCHNGREPFRYTPREAKYQLILSLFAPVAAIPVAIACSLSSALRN
jgi:hypothetical protein